MRCVNSVVHFHSPSTSTAMSEIHIREAGPSESRLRVKKSPQISDIPLLFSYTPSDDGTDENLLVLFHGLGACSRIFFDFYTHLDTLTVGDTHIPFAKLGRQLKLPQTATLTLRAPEKYNNPYLCSFLLLS